MTIYLIKMGKKGWCQKWRWKLKKFGRMNLIFGVSISKLVYITIFMKIWKKIDNFLRHFWQIEAKAKLKMIQFGKMSLIFEFFRSKLGYMAIFIKISEKRNRLIFKKVFFTNQSKKWGCR